MADERAWKKGDLCTRWVGIISRVVMVRPANPKAPPGSRQRCVRLTIVQATPLFGQLEKRTTVLAWQVRPLSLVDLGTEYMKLGNFIKEYARKNGMTE